MGFGSRVQGQYTQERKLKWRNERKMEWKLGLYRPGVYTDEGFETIRGPIGGSFKPLDPKPGLFGNSKPKKEYGFAEY